MTSSLYISLSLYIYIYIYTYFFVYIQTVARARFALRRPSTTGTSSRTRRRWTTLSDALRYVYIYIYIYMYNMCVYIRAGQSRKRRGPTPSIPAAAHARAPNLVPEGTRTSKQACIKPSKPLQASFHLRGLFGESPHDHQQHARVSASFSFAHLGDHLGFESLLARFNFILRTYALPVC